jgi:caffeoyl-CoA O-methyltransferase
VGYPDYYEAVLPKLAPRGLIAVDNTLRSGSVLDETDRSPAVMATRAFNERVRRDPRVCCVILSVRDGVSLIRRA